MTQITTCQHCQTLQHDCYGLAAKACGQCQHDKKTCQDIVVEGELPHVLLGRPCTDVIVVYPGLVAPCQAHQTVAPVNHPTQSKQVATKGKAASRPMTCPQACKVTRVTSPMPEVIEVLALTPPVAGLSQMGPPALFEGPIVLGEEGVARHGCNVR